MSDLELDETFTREYDDLKKKRVTNLILLKIEQKKIKVVRSGFVEDIEKTLKDLFDDLHCCYVIHSFKTDSADGYTSFERIVLATYTPAASKPEDRLVYEMQNGKKLSKASMGAIEIRVRSKDEFLKQINELKGRKGKTKTESDDEDDNNKDWMDD